MNAYELADELEDVDAKNYREIAANMLRQQADRIAELEKHLKTQKIGNALVKAVANFPVATPQIKELSNEQINVIAIETLGVEKDYYKFARAILKKASEK